MPVSWLIRGRVENYQSVTGKSSCGWDMELGDEAGRSLGSSVAFSDMSRHAGSQGSGPPGKFGALHGQGPALRIFPDPALYQAVEQEGTFLSWGSVFLVSACLSSILIGLPT